MSYEKAIKEGLEAGGGDQDLRDAGIPRKWRSEIRRAIRNGEPAASVAKDYGALIDEEQDVDVATLLEGIQR